MSQNAPSGADPLQMASVETAEEYVARHAAEKARREERERIAQVHGCINILVAKALKYGRAETSEAKDEATKQLQAAAEELTTFMPF